jgi:hypothetical protein
MRSVTLTTFSDGQGNALQMLGAAAPGNGTLVVRWRVITLRDAATTSRYVTVAASAGGAVGHTTCEAQRWQTGETLYTITPLSGGSNVQITLETGTHGLDIHTAGGLAFLSAQDGGAPARPMRAVNSVTSAAELTAQVNADGSVTIPAP